MAHIASARLEPARQQLSKAAAPARRASLRLRRGDRGCGGGRGGRGRAEDSAERLASWRGPACRLEGAEVVLLLADDRPRPHDAQPPHRLPRREAVRAHQPQRDERPRPADSSVTVHGDGAGGGVDDLKEGGDHAVWGAGAALEGEVKVLKAMPGEGLGVVARLVKSDNGAYAHVLEDFDKVSRTKETHVDFCVKILLTAEVQRASKCDKLARDHFLHITICRIGIIFELRNIDFTPHVTRCRISNPA